MLAPIIPIDRRSQQIVVSRSALSAAAENALAASRLAEEAIQRAIGHLFADNRAAAVNELNRIGFELQGRAEALEHLTALAEKAPTYCPDEITEPGHGRAA